MHARVIHANIADLAEAERGLNDEVIPRMKGAPGFLGAYFVAVDHLHGVSIEVFETEARPTLSRLPKVPRHLACR